ncbi:MAG: ACP S-malonyltransferase [Candidatus Muiribacteriota bacterium]
MKTALVFPGQGSQYPGMGKDFYQNFEKAEKIYKRASEIMGFPLTDKIMNGTTEDLKKTEITQPAILTTSIALFEAIKGKIGNFKAVAGHSLGEYSALYAGGVLDLEEVLLLVKKRGAAMSKIRGGHLCALIGRDFSKVPELCSETGYSIAIYNSPKQIIIAGRDEDFANLQEKASDFGIRRVKKLKVSGPFHCELMKPAAEQFKEAVNNAEIKTPDKPVYMNVSAVEEKEKEKISQNMIKQIYCQVKWKEEVENMINDGFSHFIEIGPSKVLSGIISAVSKDVKVSNIEKVEDLEKLSSVVNEGGL